LSPKINLCLAFGLVRVGKTFELFFLADTALKTIPLLNRGKGEKAN